MHFTRHSAFEETERARRADHRPRRGRLHLGRPRQASTSTASPACSSSRSATAARSSPRRPPSRPSELAFFPLWSYAHPRAIELAERLAPATPRATSTGSSSPPVAARRSRRAWKLAKQYFKLTGKPTKHKVISRTVAYHGTPQGALSITGIPAAKEMFEPLVPGALQGAEHQPVPRAGAPARRREGLRPLGRRPDRRGDRVRGMGTQRLVRGHRCPLRHLTAPLRNPWSRRSARSRCRGCSPARAL